jgi:opacity protein-like surface antigen
MSRQRVLTGAIVLALAASAVSFATVADAAVVKHHVVHHIAAHHDAGHHPVVRRYVRTGIPGGVFSDDDWVADNGWIDGYYNGYGDYSRYGDDYCGTIEWTLEQCGPHGP